MDARNFGPYNIFLLFAWASKYGPLMVYGIQWVNKDFRFGTHTKSLTICGELDGIGGCQLR